MLSHYTSAEELIPRSMEQSPGPKPRGLWVSVDGPDDWAWWCRSEQFRDIDNSHRFEVVLKPDANILTIDSAEGIAALTATYPSRDHAMRGLGDYFIDWVAIAAKYQGIVIAPYQWSMRLAGGHSWYYGWDCASGCIWDADVIAEVRRLTEAVAS